MNTGLRQLLRTAWPARRPAVATPEGQVLAELAALTAKHGPWEAARRLFAPETGTPGSRP
ncbi:hypothetical protein [Sphaerimonospora thailandensis]|uniref:Uncharacterized protein n=1 Tax=Sphaerimonospora thailandensis TaxID=795644 RepID=A0A8J3R805_9ACTN|nr:hypothetical protein [Sphaerimonospora thailandensis]GIH69456.1 hypothetical protein Mth01_17090 [Sphaerimonospora thailandensis]